MKTLKPRLAAFNTSRVKPVQGINGEAWRQGKTTAERGYGGTWQKTRAAYLRAHSLCCYCQRNGRLVAATVLDHIVPHKGDMERFWDSANWQPLCQPCHDSTKKREEGGGSKV